MKSQDIIVGVDFSDSSKAALREAGHLASMRKSWLNVVHVIDSEFFEREIDQKFLTVDQLTRQAENALKDFALVALDRPPSLRFFVFVGHPFEELLKQTESLKCDLLVLGSYGNSGKSDRVGTTAVRFVRKAPVPVLLVREKQRSPFKDIVACFDYSDTSRRALEYAAELASVHEARLRLVHVIQSYPQPYIGIYGELPSLPGSFYEDRISNAQSRLDVELEEIRKMDPDLDATAVIRDGPSPASAIYDYVEEVNADLAVLGTRGRTGFKKLLLGTTAEHIIHKCPCSVLAIKPSDFEA